MGERGKVGSLAALAKSISLLILVSGGVLWVWGYYLEKGSDFAWALAGFVGFVVILLLVLFTLRVLMDGLTKREVAMMNSNLRENIALMQQVQRAINIQNQNSLLKQRQPPQLPAPEELVGYEEFLQIDESAFNRLEDNDD